MDDRGYGVKMMTMTARLTLKMIMVTMMIMMVMMMIMVTMMIMMVMIMFMMVTMMIMMVTMMIMMRMMIMMVVVMVMVIIMDYDSDGDDDNYDADDDDGDGGGEDDDDGDDDYDVFLVCCRCCCQVGREGEYVLGQLCVEVGNLHYVWPQLSLAREAQSFAIVSDPPNLALQDRGEPRYRSCTSFVYLFLSFFLVFETAPTFCVSFYSFIPLTLALPRVVNLKFLLQLHQKDHITQYGELGFS